MSKLETHDRTTIPNSDQVISRNFIFQITGENCSGGGVIGELRAALNPSSLLNKQGTLKVSFEDGMNMATIRSRVAHIAGISGPSLS
ncbi:hypothetical protein HOF56_00370 [Candidatus Peribacteria bacterium]|jgi:hypothetical protein|nr:hypothetical protein [Candidatus Peribacteria bacterium]MBT4021589.1 hypothetical protein [Candidatus Peribacteria bacterium]MBT4240749.1 hypothetical protein [Candidatus Peribacteria bacterium]MBT4474303.1 hypothetical protein [Candidatus Peribacteria bacterium]